LGVPAWIGKNKGQAFKEIVERVRKKLINWKVKFLSQVGKEILFKDVGQAIPTYTMSVFQVPISLCLELNRMMQKFWWGHMEKSSKIHWCSWEKLGKSKAIGGLAFRDLRLFNKALLAKLGWRLLNQPSSIIAQILKAKYFPHSSFLDSNLVNRLSFIWRSMFGAKELLKEGLIWRVGDGRSIKVWGDRWLPTPVTHAVQTPINNLADTSMVEMLIDKEQGGWNSTLVQNIFSPVEAEVILNLPLSPLYSPDRLTWKDTNDGVFSVRNAYHLGGRITSKQ
jgi:hypothetical protein